MTNEQKKQEFIKDLKNCNSKEDEQKMMEKWKIGESVFKFYADLKNCNSKEDEIKMMEEWKIKKSTFQKAKKQLGIKEKCGRKNKLDFLNVIINPN